MYLGCELYGALIYERKQWCRRQNNPTSSSSDLSTDDDHDCCSSWIYFDRGVSGQQQEHQDYSFLDYDLRQFGANFGTAEQE